MEQNQPEGSLSWRLSSHPITLLWFLAFRISSLLVYLFGGIIFTANHVLIFIITILLLAADFYYLKNIAGRRLVGLRWWNEVNPQTGDSHWVFESSDPSTKVINATDKRFFWMALYSQPLLWVALAVVALLRFEVIWLTLVVIALSLTVTNTLAFSRCDKFGQASNIAGSAWSSGGLAGNVATGLVGRFFSSRG
ncbi:Golgi apparatus membrane protein [Lachnellula occidentalis]|uniref:Golgi apparatus membrane protein TVP23 n=1 Tax=Lachnellula occidentalis TaxID=215460 RepID=A0A8H8U796_9HELO|nr:Golgi apparatus membrane protein [Lachnellula occidentalis]